ncbi:hydroxyacylglutathione hydrolase [Aquicella lusitana]|uniref:Hydroxyacylglutathione hydrolase n=1 Tax=Aquicella lusitana TaxID=254246 RepID=A0A370GLC4_9COXI|nr:hydroxyacylglutathione hydrolase [Aquicella lusitana]RDI44578.1 hydroxyacylglutathione hydrolase [Aquicella lusitana]VVC72480.1 Hydroxyacylglutathione hydrolase [Aquicella lusitana]
MAHITIHPIPTLKDNYVWALIDQHQRHVLIVDPGEAAPVIHYITQHHLLPVGILVTHHHWDHTNGIVELSNLYSVPVYGPAKETIRGVTHKVQEKDEIIIDHFPLTLQVVDIPGHTLGHIAYYAQDSVFCGDTLFAAGCGRLFEGTPEMLYASLQKIAALPDTTKIYCAHEYTLANLRFAEAVEPDNQKIYERLEHVKHLRAKDLPTLPCALAEEKATNPFLRCDVPEIITSAEKHDGSSLKNPVAVFTSLRRWKDNFV